MFSTPSHHRLDKIPRRTGWTTATLGLAGSALPFAPGGDESGFGGSGHRIAGEGNCR